MHITTKIPPRFLIGLFLLFLFYICLAVSPLGWNQSMDNTMTDGLFKFCGDRPISDDIVILFIGADDVLAMDGWPITRDYYGYITHILSHYGAKVIGFDILFDTKDLYYPEFDEALAEFMKTSNNVCLSMAFSGLTDSLRENRSQKGQNELMLGVDPVFPLKKFRDQAAGIGFSNLGNETIVRHVPLVTTHADSFLFSFGFECAFLYLDGRRQTIKVSDRFVSFETKSGKPVSLPVNKKGQFRMNHLGSPEQMSAISFVDLLQAFKANPDSIQFSGKLVIVAVTSPGISPVKVTPMAAAFPATFLHATVAENIIERTFLRPLSILFQILIMVILSCVSLILYLNIRDRFFLFIGLVLFLFYWMIVILLFKYTFIVLPLFYPTLIYLSTLLYFELLKNRQKRIDNRSQSDLYKALIQKKETQLLEAEQEISKVEQTLQQELQEKEELSKKSQLLLEEKKRKVMFLEKQLGDLQSFLVPPKRLKYHFPEIIHDENSALVPVLELIRKLGSDIIPVLISGETGTGKELIALAIHNLSKRSSSRFVAVNCGALPETLLESELFGHEKGSFTGAQKQRKGRFELADGGTLFLDEVTETTPSFQAKLLRVLQEGTFERLGGEKTIRVDTRIIAASSKDLKEVVENGLFRQDLFYRLNGFPLTLPPLRERGVDIPLLAAHFLRKHGYQSIKSFSKRAMEVLTDYHWPGNVRELENVVRRSAILAQSENSTMIQFENLPEEIREHEFRPDSESHYRALEQHILFLLRTLKFSHSSISQVARELGNRDRGTITEYFRGLCFEYLVKSDFDVDAAVKGLSDSSDEKVNSRVKVKIEEYLNNVREKLKNSSEKAMMAENKIPASKGLPKKYHPYLKEVIEFISQKSET